MVLGLFTRWFSGWALLIGWAVGMLVGTSLSWGATSWVPVHVLKWDVPFVGLIDLGQIGVAFAAYNGLVAVLANFVVAALLSIVLRPRGVDETSPEDYLDAETAH